MKTAPCLGKARGPTGSLRRARVRSSHGAAGAHAHWHEAVMWSTVQDRMFVKLHWLEQLRKLAKLAVQGAIDVLNT